MRIAICEDEKAEAEKLAEEIKNWAGAKKIAVDIRCYGNSEAFLMVWPDIAFDLIFIDIKLGNMDGMGLAEHIRKTDQDIMIAFYTKFKKYTLRGYDVGALHYLIKPVAASKIILVLDKAYAVLQSRYKEFLVVPSDIGCHKLSCSDIYYISMFAHNAEIHATDVKYVIRKPAKELLTLLPAHFLQCHRSCIVNLFKVDCLYKESMVLCNGENLTVSRSNIKKVKDAFLRLSWGGGLE
ncbi:MAG: LytTR family DNA-binding domain-containing protein [Oscillospiraceae bacterium]|nr:LytTR family DNA-binding domain-containing protein [Oscillospiraceae bacterium]